MNPDVEYLLRSHPPEAAARLRRLRSLIFEVARTEKLGDVEESLKWGHPSYVTSQGSAIRLGWNHKDPQLCALYFHCQSSLVDTFRQLYAGGLEFQGNRAILLNLRDDLPLSVLRRCISLALRYHQIKHLPLLGSETELRSRVEGKS